MRTKLEKKTKEHEWYLVNKDRLHEKYMRDRKNYLKKQKQYKELKKNLRLNRSLRRQVTIAENKNDKLITSKKELTEQNKMLQEYLDSLSHDRNKATWGTF